MLISHVSLKFYRGFLVSEANPVHEYDNIGDCCELTGCKRAFSSMYLCLSSKVEDDMIVRLTKSLCFGWYDELEPGKILNALCWSWWKFVSKALKCVECWVRKRAIESDGEICLFWNTRYLSCEIRHSIVVLFVINWYNVFAMRFQTNLFIQRDVRSSLLTSWSL